VATHLGNMGESGNWKMIGEFESDLGKVMGSGKILESVFLPMI